MGPANPTLVSAPSGGPQLRYQTLAAFDVPGDVQFMEWGDANV